MVELLLLLGVEVLAFLAEPANRYGIGTIQEVLFGHSKVHLDPWGEVGFVAYLEVYEGVEFLHDELLGVMLRESLDYVEHYRLGTRKLCVK